MYVEKAQRHVDAFYECSTCEELIDTMFHCSEHLVQCGMIDLNGENIFCEGIMPHHIDVMNGLFLLCKDKAEHLGHVLLVGPVVEDKFDMFLFGSRFHIDQTTGISEIPAIYREEIIAIASGVLSGLL